MEPCMDCRLAFEPEVIVPGLWKLMYLHGYMIDLRLKELRTMTGRLKFIPFASRKGQRILKQLHDQRVALESINPW